MNHKKKLEAQELKQSTNSNALVVDKKMDIYYRLTIQKFNDNLF